MKIRFGFGTGFQDVEVPDNNLIGELHANPVPVGLKGEEEVVRAMRNPIGSLMLRDIVHSGESVAIVTSDITRPMPTAQVMPAILDELYAGGVKKEDITLIFALGSHRRQSKEEKRKLAGERAWHEIRCIDSNPEDCVSYGTTSLGTPVDITRAVSEADRRICLGNIEYHYFAGYSGGAKAIMPGTSTRKAIQANHRYMISPECCAGSLETNPIRMDIEEAGKMVSIDYILNVVLSEHKEIIHAVAGDPVKAHREGCRFLDKLYRKEIKEAADIVLVSQGGAPKDLNLYQTQKALDNAKQAVKDGGIIILIGSCREGMGESTFEDWMTNSPNSHAIIDRVEHEFRLGGHKAAAIAMVLEHAEIYLVSELDDDFVRSIFMDPQPSAQTALDRAFTKMGPQARVLAIPYGGSILPVVCK